MIKLNRGIWLLCLLTVTIMLVSCGTTDSKPETYTKTITAINGQTGEPLDGCTWNSSISDGWIAEGTSSITVTEEVGAEIGYEAFKDVADGGWRSEIVWITFDDDEPEEIVLEKYEY